MKGKTIAIIGYGSQGHAQAQNLRDSGCEVDRRPAPRLGRTTTSRSRTASSPSPPPRPRRRGDLVNLLLPDEVTADIYAKDVKPNLKPGDLLLCSHGFNIHFGQVVPPLGRR